MTPGKRNACAVALGSVAVRSDRSQTCTGVGEATKASSRCVHRAEPAPEPHLDLHGSIWQIHQPRRREQGEPDDAEVFQEPKRAA